MAVPTLTDCDDLPIVRDSDGDEKETTHKPGDLEIPRFSSGVTNALLENRSAEIWHELVDELQLFFSRYKYITDNTAITH